MRHVQVNRLVVIVVVVLLAACVAFALIQS
jgi:hypothetical protein